MKGRLRNTRRFVADPIDFLSDASAAHGSVFRFELVNDTMLALTHPHHIKYILQERMRNFTRETQMYDLLDAFAGQGLATIADNDRWRRNRRLVQPAFHHQQIGQLCATVVDEVDILCERWAGHARRGEPVNLSEQLSHFALRVVVRALFGTDPDHAHVTEFARAAENANVELGRFIRMPLIPLKVPTPSHRRFWRSIAEMDAVVYDVIAGLRANDTGGLLSLLMNTEDEDTSERFTDKELRDEVITMLFAGHESTASALTSAMLLLSTHPEERNLLRDKVDIALPGGHAELADLPELAYTKQVIEEVLRIRPPVWMGQRRAVADDEIGGLHVPAGTSVVFSYYHAHRHPDFWDRPEVFDPQRFTPEATAARDRNALLPFGAGGHICIANAFAMTEMQLALATIARRFDWTVTDPDLTPVSALTLTTRAPVVATLIERN